MNIHKTQMGILGGVFCVLAIWGGVNKTKYTDIREEADYLMTMQVPEISEEMAIETCKVMEEELPESPLVLVVAPVDEMEFVFWSGRQKVVVEDIKKEDETGSVKTPDIGSEIWIVNPFWYLRMWEKDRQYVNLCGVNTMMKDGQYLVFLDEVLQGVDGVGPAYKLVDGEVISPVFSLDKKTNTIVEHGEYMTVPYASLCENEFFGENEAANQSWIALKNKMLELYVQ